MNILKKIVSRKNYLFNREKYNYLSLSFAQEGEDKILDDYFAYKKSGFYVEVGAHHPQRFSNSYLFYLKGWNGINIDALPGSMEAFNKLRPRDINLEIGISNVPAILPFFIFEEAALNTFDRVVAIARSADNRNKIIKEVAVPLRSLADVLRENLPQSASIDFLSIDVEGYDFQVLLSNDWNIYRPSVVLIEEGGSAIGLSPISDFMTSIGYSLFARTNRNSFFKDIT